MDSIVRIWDLSLKKCVHALEGHKGNIWSVIFVNEWKIATCSSDKTIKIWDISEGFKFFSRCKETLKGHQDEVN